jgi:hypothetical protein
MSISVFKSKPVVQNMRFRFTSAGGVWVINANDIYVEESNFQNVTPRKMKVYFTWMYSDNLVLS